MTSKHSIKFSVTLAALVLCGALVSLLPQPAKASEMAYLSFPAGKKEFRETINNLIRDYGKDSFLV